MPDTDPITLKGGVVTYDRRLDRIPSQNEGRLEAYPIRAALPSTVVPVTKYWRLGLVTDQLREGACVGHGWTSDAMASPARVHIGPTWTTPTFADDPSVYASGVYRAAQKIDEFPGEDYEGTSVDAGAKVMHQRGLIGEYRWARDLNDVRDTIITTGPVILGIVWYESMYDPTSTRRLKVSGAIAGGHCILAYGYNPHYYVGSRYQEIFRLRNSWGSDWGSNGNAWITRDDLQEIWYQGGEGCVPLKRYATPTAA